MPTRIEWWRDRVRSAAIPVAVVIVVAFVASFLTVATVTTTVMRGADCIYVGGLPLVF